MSAACKVRAHFVACFVCVFALGGATPAQVSSERPLVPDAFRLSDEARAVIDAPWLTEDERSDLRIFHGVWDDRDLRTPARRARAAMIAGRWGDPALRDRNAPIEAQAEAMMLAGDVRQAARLLADAESVRAARIRAEAFELLGDHEQAMRAIRPLVDLLLREQMTEASELTDGVIALSVRARLEGQPARDYQTMMSLLGRAHQELDRFYWPARLAEAVLLYEKHNDREAVEALHEALTLNPRCGQAWYLLGRIALDKFDFEGAQRAIAALQRLERHHPLARLLYAEARLVEDDPDEVLEVANGVLLTFPNQRRALALTAAAHAMLYDEEALKAALDAYDALSPGSAEAYYTAGQALALFRQYDEAAELLEEAVRRKPAWPAPQIELGLMEMQTGRDHKALFVLEEVLELDPFNKRAANSKFLLEDLTEYEERETEHFIIRYRKGEDEVLVDLMEEPLERIHDDVTERFGWELAQKTILEVMPDHKRFSVRVTGMPHIHTIAACTGPIIAMEVPREGKPSMHLGTFDWLRVIRHEFAHTVTLEQTHNRIPHWLTEAAAVSMEGMPNYEDGVWTIRPAPREYNDCITLAESLRKGTLFNLDEIKWAFVRPRRPGDRGKAYSQGHWMVEFMNERFGEETLVALLSHYFAGEREETAIPSALGISRDRFFEDFLVWAQDEIKRWGLDPEPSMTELKDELRDTNPDLARIMAVSEQARLDAIAETMVGRIGKPSSGNDRPFDATNWPPILRPPVEIPDETLAEWREAHPDHPDLLLEFIRRAIDADGDPSQAHVALLERYVELRPVDPWPHQKLAQIHLAGETPERAIPHLEELDIREQKSPVFAEQLSLLYRKRGDLDRAYEKMLRAANIDPYRASIREEAAAIAVQLQKLDDARMHIKALTILEPDRPQHQRRLEAIDRMIEQRTTAAG